MKPTQQVTVYFLDNALSNPYRSNEHNPDFRALVQKRWKVLGHQLGDKFLQLVLEDGSTLVFKTDSFAYIKTKMIGEAAEEFIRETSDSPDLQ